MVEYRQYCPVARAAEIFADRWTPLIMRELVAGSRHFNELQRGLPRISRSLLASRLRRLEDAGVIARRRAPPNAVDYDLTAAGRGLGTVIDALGAWGARWAFGEPRPRELDPVLLLWRMHRRGELDLVPKPRLVIEFDFTGRCGRRLWMVLEPREASVCLRPPGFDPDLVVRAELALFHRVWLRGAVDFRRAVDAGIITVEGAPKLRRGLPRLFKWSPMAPWVRMARSPDKENRP